MSHHLILTVDYEVFGNGTGSVRDCVTKPTDRLLEVAAHHSAPVTLFVEALEFAVMQDGRDDRSRPNASRSIERVESQIRQAAADGHDVQLHLHPQWLEARAGSDGRWHVDRSEWRLGDCPRTRLEKMMDVGTSFLRRTLADVRPEYSPRVFRAGGWCIQPSDRVLKALARRNVVIDSSVAPGLSLGARRRWYDFSDAPPGRAHWKVDRDVCTPSVSGAVHEVPIAVGRYGVAENVRHLLGSYLGGIRRSPAGCSGSFEGNAEPRETMSAALSKLYHLGTSMLDFCKLSADALRTVTDDWIDSCSPAAEGDLPIVAIGHAKTFTRRSERELDEYLSSMADRDDIEFSTFGDWAARQENGPELEETAG